MLSMTDNAINEAFKNLRDDEELASHFRTLQDAGLNLIG